MRYAHRYLGAAEITPMVGLSAADLTPMVGLGVGEEEIVRRTATAEQEARLRARARDTKYAATTTYLRSGGNATTERRAELLRQRGGAREAELLSRDGGAGSGAGEDYCGCFVSRLGEFLAAQGQADDPAGREQLRAQCAADPALFARNVVASAPFQALVSQGLDVSACVPPVVEEKSNTLLWVAGGAAALGVLYFAMRKKA
jgi:hypothetical protein